jgi:hypothetical protein
MQMAIVQGLAAILTTLTLIGCTPQPKPFPAKSPEEIKQLTDVTDAVVELVRSPERDEALRQALAALSAANGQYRQHKDAILSETNSELMGCISSHAIGVLDLEGMLAKRDEAASRQDEAKLEGHNGMLWLLAAEMGECTARSSLSLIDPEQRPEALKHAAVVISEIYSAVVIFRAAAGLKVAPLLKDQVRDYETVVTRLGPDHGLQVVTDALPKLKATLATLE